MSGEKRVASKVKNKDDKGGKLKALDIAVSQIEKQHGRGSIMRLGEAGAHVGTQVIPSGCLSLDIALGTGGFPRGGVVEVFGPESSGKTCLALTVVAQAQKLGGVATFIDAEHALDPEWARKIGVDVDSLLVSQPDSAEQALDIAETLVRSNAVDIVVVDSVAALVPRAEIEGDMGDIHMGLQARLMSQALRKLTSSIHKSRTCMMFINQIREKIGVMFGNPETTPGGRALKFYSAVRVDIRRIGAIKEGKEHSGNRVRAKIVKNKLAPPFRLAEFDLLFQEGISREGALIDAALDFEVLSRSGAWFTYNGENIGQGRENVRQFLKDNDDVRQQIERETMTRSGLHGPNEQADEQAPAEA
jgi:recombination protein RecA